MTLLRPKVRPAQTASTTRSKETEDPFADMIEEGDGPLAQWKAQAAKKRKAA